MRIHPFRALRPIPERAAALSVPPYDVVTTEEARALAQGVPDSFFWVTRPDIAFPEGEAAPPERQHETARQALDRLIRQGSLVREEVPVYFLYRLIRKGRPQRGVVACFETADYGTLIRRHEKTRPDKEEDRQRHVAALRTHDEPVFLLCRDRSDFTAFCDQQEQAIPLYDFTAPDGVRHTLWPVREPDRLAPILERIPCAYIADGHHRAAAAVRVAAETFLPSAPVDPVEQRRFLAVLFPASELEILPYHRLVRDLRGMTEKQFLEALQQRVSVEAAAGPAADRHGRCSLFLAGRWYTVTFRPPSEADPCASLDVQMLQDQVLGPILGIENPRTDPRIAFVGGIKGEGELVRRVEAGEAAAAFAMAPVTVQQLIAIADAGRTLPPKSTWFEPKLRSGLFLHPFFP